MSRQSKFSAVKTVCGAGHKHDSKMEAARCDALTTMEAAGEIYELEQQPEFRVMIDGKLMCRYIADFSWRTGGVQITEDVKGVVTPMFNLKKKLVEATHPGVVIAIYPPRKRKVRKKAVAKK